MNEGGWRAWRWHLLAGSAGLLLLVCLFAWLQQVHLWWRETVFTRSLTTPQMQLEEKLKQLGRENRELLNLFTRKAMTQRQVERLFLVADSLNLSIDNFVVRADRKKGKLERQQVRLECRGSFNGNLSYLQWLEAKTQGFHVQEVFLVRINEEVVLSVDGYLLRSLD